MHVKEANQRIGGNYNASSTVCYSFGNGRVHHTCTKVKRINKPSHIGPRLCGKEYKQKNEINNIILGDVKEYGYVCCHNRFWELQIGKQRPVYLVGTASMQNSKRPVYLVGIASNQILNPNLKTEFSDNCHTALELWLLAEKVLHSQLPVMITSWKGIAPKTENY